ncbi:hypothetical protein B0J12DRAFT_118246 [Macrophomina phaseolina]|uniref:Transcription factor domain-containing protein n=1 Tax=Macrophomina phaseolina TaxID=35725 RepID=A0ABQ8G7S6_9PEZI|nr:hypothetical protein B0J12DRAFT_118246 [Macrophomina phaseolina]
MSAMPPAKVCGFSPGSCAVADPPESNAPVRAAFHAKGLVCPPPVGSVLTAIRCKSSGAECRFVQPRAVARTGAGPDASPVVVPSDHTAHLSRLERQIAQLTGVVEGLRSDVGSLRANLRDEPTVLGRQSLRAADSSNLLVELDQGTDTEWASVMFRGDIINKGIVSEQEAAELYQMFLARCNDTIAILDGVTEPFEVVRQDPVLLAAICTLGARASSSNPGLYQRCRAAAMSLVSTLAFGPTPSLMALTGLILISAWHRSDRLWGMAIALAYEMELQHDAVRLPQHVAQMTQAEIKRARTWLSIFCFELMAKTYRPYLIDGIERYLDLAQDLVHSPYSRPVDHRIMAYLQLFKIVVEARKHPLSQLSTIAQEARLATLNEALDTWFHRVHNSIDPLYQTFSKPQDRNRLIIPYAFVRL